MQPEQKDPTERIVYLLGAGFSAPLGLPIMSNFLLKAKDIYFQHPKKYAHFTNILQTIDGMHKAKSYYEVDLFNIEEIFSILDMEDQVSGLDRSAQFADFLKSVISAFTPLIPEPSLPRRSAGLFKELSGGFQSGMFGSGDLIAAYGYFTSTLLGLRYDTENVDDSGTGVGSYIQTSQLANRKCTYNVITLNYDLVIENYIKHILTHFNPRGSNLGFINSFSLAKLHGSIDTSIVAPTWKKWTVGSLQGMWQKAFHCLSNATQIRILGYSLPVSDSYVRYLLEASALNSKHLKHIDIISLDDEQNTLQTRYANFIGFKYARFRNANIQEYLSTEDDSLGFKRFCTPSKKQTEHTVTFAVDFNRFEGFHNGFMDGRSLR